MRNLYVEPWTAVRYVTRRADPRRVGNVIRQDKRRDPYIPGRPIFKQLYKCTEEIIKAYSFKFGQPVSLFASHHHELPFRESSLFGRNYDPEPTFKDYFSDVQGHNMKEYWLFVKYW